MPGITVEPVISQNIIVITWTQQVSVDDVYFAFRRLNRMLTDSLEPVYVIMDITSNPTMPITATISSVIANAHLHPRLAEWLFVGENGLARLIERVLLDMTGKRNMRWFRSHEDAGIYLGSLLLN